jgi:drug/metabolite transporter (DMT)-like permease
MFSIAKRALPLIDAFTLGSLRYIVGVALFALLLALFEGREGFRYGRRFWPAVAFGVIGITGFNTLVWYGLNFTRPEHAAILMALQTPMTALAVWLTRGARPATFTLACVAVAIGGVLLVVTQGDPVHAWVEGMQGGALLGDLYVFLGALAWVIYSMAGSRFLGWSPLKMSTLTCLPGAVGLVIANGVAVATGFVPMPTPDMVLSVWWQLLYFSAGSVVLGVLGFNAGVKHLGALNAMLMLNLIPVSVFCLEAVLGRSYHAVEIAGTVVVVGALAANNLYLRRG